MPASRGAESSPQTSGPGSRGAAAGIQTSMTSIGSYGGEVAGRVIPRVAVILPTAGATRSS
jgi:hypothetical protein